jgi:hypothetical protein
MAESGVTRYLEIRRFPMLEPHEEYMLAKRWREHGDRDAAHRLVTSHLRLVAKIAMGYRGYGLAVIASRIRFAVGTGVKCAGISRNTQGHLTPDEIRILVAAFDKAWGSVQASGAIFDTDAKTELARATLATIIEAAKHGERDQGRLRDGALMAFTRSNLRSVPPPLR